MLDLVLKPKISKKSIGFQFIKEYHNVLYAVYAYFLLRTVVIVSLETNGVHTHSSYQKLNVRH